MSLRIIPIVCPGEDIIGMGRLQEFGYDVSPHLAELMDYSDLLDDYPTDKLQDWLGYVPEVINDRYRRSLRTSWHQVLEKNIAEPDTTIFAESDVWPCDAAKAEAIGKLLEDELLPLAKAKGYDVIRLFNDCFDSYPDEEIKLENVKWKHWVTQVGHMAYDIRSQGTHALVVPMESRHKVARIFSSIKLPTDTALEYAAQMGMIRVLTADANIFMQRTKTRNDIQDSAYSGKLRRFLVCMTSYKRPFDLMRQIYTFMDQTYSLFHMAVVIRGISEHDVLKFIIPSIRHFVVEGRLTLKYGPNRSCFSNTVECFMDTDLSQYDYICKVDDDDWYSREYLSTINNFLNYVGDNSHGLYNSKQGYEIQYQNGVPVWVKKDQPIYENTIVFPISVAMQLINMYNTGRVGQAPKYSPKTDRNGVVWGDGAIIRKLMEQQGAHDIGEFAEKRVPFLSVVNKTNASFLREGNYIPEEQRRAALKSGNFRDVVSEQVVRLGEETCRVIGNRADMVATGQKGTADLRKNGIIAIRWDNGAIETWKRTDNGSYMLCDSI